jgi:ribosomal protein S18 acetylase RimI-like enzyme
VSARRYTADDAEDVHRLLDEAYLGWDDEYVVVPHTEWLAFMTTGSDYDPGCWFLAETQSGRLAGVCLNWSTGWVKDLAVRPEWRRRGLGEALLRHSFHELFRRGVRRIGLKVDSNNGTGAPRLYERLGFVTDRRYTMFAKRL